MSDHAVSAELQQFDDYDSLEQGLARENSEDVMQAIDPSEKWKQCKLETSEEGVLRMYDDSNNTFMLSAVKRSKDFYISQYEDGGADQESASWFESEGNQPPPRFSAVLRLKSNERGFKLYSTSCERCDAGLHKFTCGSDRLERQHLADINHSLRTISGTSVSGRYLSIRIPFVLEDRSRVIWCPRAIREKDDHRSSSPRTMSPLGSPMCSRRNSSLEFKVPTSPRPGNSRRSLTLAAAKGSAAAALATGTTGGFEGGSPTSDRLNKAAAALSEGLTADSSDADYSPTPSACDSPINSRRSSTREPGTPVSIPKESVAICSKLPVWNEDLNSLVLNFEEKRVTRASTKNIVIMGKEDAEVLFQFGKCGLGRYALDFKAPLAPIQALAMALSMFDWRGDTN